MQRVGRRVDTTRELVARTHEVRYGVYYDAAQICEQLMDGRRHVFEAELKEQRRTRGLEGHESRPDEIGL
jgi:hypothetical protein